MAGIKRQAKSKKQKKVRKKRRKQTVADLFRGEEAYKEGTESNKILTQLVLPPFKDALQELEASEWPIARMLSVWFSEETRKVYFAYAKHNFTIRGKYWQLAGWKTADAGPRHVRKGTLFIVREDAAFPYSVDLQLIFPSDTNELAPPAAPEWEELPRALTDHVYTVKKRVFEMVIKQHLEIKK